MQRYNNLTPLPHDNFVKFLTMFEVSSIVSFEIRILPEGKEEIPEEG